MGACPNGAKGQRAAVGAFEGLTPRLGAFFFTRSSAGFSFNS